jgi:hypothetical protein
MFRLRCILLAMVGTLLLLAAPALAKTTKTTTRSCSSVTVGRYKASNIRVKQTLGCKTPVVDLKYWLKKPTKLPTNKKSWHAKLVKGPWQMAYGKYPVSLTFVLTKKSAPKSHPKHAPKPTPKPTPQLSVKSVSGDPHQPGSTSSSSAESQRQGDDAD